MTPEDTGLAILQNCPDAMRISGMKEQIAAAIRVAVAAERERCKKIHQDYIDKSNVLHLASVLEEREACALIAEAERWAKEYPSGSQTYDVAWSDAAKSICEDIRARSSEKAAPEKTEAADTTT